MLNPNTCGTCVEAKCCEDLLACDNDPTCSACLSGAQNPECNSNQELLALDQCAGTACQAECSGGSGGSGGNTGSADCEAPKESPSKGSCVAGLVGSDSQFPCNPVTNEGCNTAAGQACDFGENGFQCYDPPNDKDLCQACGQQAGYCKGGQTCVGSKCAKFCCDDGDCGKGKCDKEAIGAGSPLGICLTEGSGGSGGSGGAAPAPDCKAPKESPTKGACFTGKGCNPVTNDTCNTAAGEACDLSNGGTFECFPAPNDVALCGACDNANGPFCLAGSACLGGKCAKYCCDDTDCSEGATCGAKGSDGVGFCIEGSGAGGSGGAAGSAGAGGDGGGAGDGGAAGDAGAGGSDAGAGGSDAGSGGASAGSAGEAGSGGAAAGSGGAAAGSGGAGAGSGGAAAGSGGAAAGSGGSAGSSAGAAGSAGGLSETCQTCATTSCGNQLAACAGNPVCADCLQNPAQAKCGNNAQLAAAIACVCKADGCGAKDCANECKALNP
jgi:hypothetical protein